MKRREILLVLPLAGLLGFGCSGSDDDDAGVLDGSSPIDAGMRPDAGATGDPDAPALGALIDRMGRPAIATALIAPIADEPAKGEAKDAYNMTAPSGWSELTGDIAGVLGVYDGLDGTCGNQLLAGTSSASPMMRYGALAGALAEDRLYVISTNGTCTQYFAAELAATGIAPGLASDCGGRAPAYDVIDVTYSALAAGMISGVGDGVDDDDASPSATDFPFLAAP